MNLKIAKSVWAWLIVLGLCALLASPLGAAPSRTTPPDTHDMIYAVTVANHLLHFQSATPGTILGDVAISGLQVNEYILAIDFRPHTSELYGLGSSSRLYRINIYSGQTTLVGAGAFTPALSGNQYGFDFNPVVDRIRVVGDDDQNIRLNPDTAAVAGPDTPIAFAPTDVYSQANAIAVGVAYSNNTLTATLTTLYAYEYTYDVLVTQGGVNGAPSANGGQLFTVGISGVITCNPLVGLDIAASGQAYASLHTNPTCGTAGLYAVNLGSGSVVLIGSIGGGAQIRDIAAELPYVLYVPLVKR